MKTLSHFRKDHGLSIAQWGFQTWSRRSSKQFRHLLWRGSVTPSKRRPQLSLLWKLCVTVASNLQHQAPTDQLQTEPWHLQIGMVQFQSISDRISTLLASPLESSKPTTRYSVDSVVDFYFFEFNIFLWDPGIIEPSMSPKPPRWSGWKLQLLCRVSQIWRSSGPLQGAYGCRTLVLQSAFWGMVSYLGSTLDHGWRLRQARRETLSK